MITSIKSTESLVVCDCDSIKIPTNFNLSLVFVRNYRVHPRVGAGCSPTEMTVLFLLRSLTNEQTDLLKVCNYRHPYTPETPKVRHQPLKERKNRHGKRIELDG